MNSDDDLGGYTTPVNQPKPRALRSQGSNIAGPSKPNSRTRQKPAEPRPEIIIDIDDGQDDEEFERNAAPARASRNQTSREPATVKQTSTKGKGKAKAKPPNSKTRTEDIGDEVEVVAVSESETGAESEFMPARTKKSVGDAAWRKRCEKLEKLLRREMKSREEADNRYETVTKQLDNLMRVRETEAEALMNAQKEQYEARITALEKVNTELTSALAKIQPLAGFGKSSIVLTRDAADEEKRQIEQEAMKWRDKYEEARGQMKEKEQTEKELKYELELERKNGQALKVKQQSSAPRPRGGGGELLGSDHPPTLQTIRFYEDFTNLLIVRMKPQLSSFLDLQDWTMGCIFTYIPENDEEKRWSLNFNLTCSWEKRDPDDSAPVTSTSDLHEMMYYEPLELDKESPEIVARLGIISSGFSFTRDQVALFLRTLYNTFEEAVAGPGEEEKGEEGEEMSVSD